MSSRFTTALWVAGATVGMALTTIVVYLVRATGPLSSNWPVTYNLTSSDNGVLYQLMQDLFAGRPLDWSFSPQTYTFPEIPISFVAFVVTAGNLYWYYIAVAAINVALLFLVLYLLVRYLYPGPQLGQQLLRTLIAAAPLVILPLFTINSMYLFQIAPTYYYGIYLLGLLLPVALLTSKSWVRIVVLVAYAVTGAADPLLLAMTLPGVALALLLTFLRHGWRGAFVRQAAFAAGTVVVSFGLRLLVLSPMVAADPTSYISATRAFGRDREIYQQFKTGFQQGFDALLLALTVAALVACAIALLIALRRFFARPPSDLDAEHRLIARIYLASLPFLGAFAMYVIMAVHIYYLWFGVVGSIVIALLLWPRPRLLAPLAILLVSILAVGSVITLVQNMNRSDRVDYFGARDSLTECLDAEVGGRIGNDAVGYGTFSDSRHYGLTSQTGIRMIQVGPNMEPNFWLTNRALASTEVGQFVFVNPDSAESGFVPDHIRAGFGEPDAVVSCGTSGVEIWFYDSAAATERVAAFYRDWAATKQ